MGIPQLPDELAMTLTESLPCREEQLRLFQALLSPRLPSPHTLVVHGPTATAKSTLVAAHLASSTIRHAIVRCRECVTGRHLLEQTVTSITRAVHDESANDEPDFLSGRCESLGALAVHIERRLRDQTKFVLVFDGIDKQREAPPTLLQSLARLGEVIASLTAVLIVRHPSPRFLHSTGIPHIHFPAYSREQSVHIVSRKPLDIFLELPSTEDYDDEAHDEDKAWLWPRFCSAVWDSLGQNASRDFVSFKSTCHKLWRPFVTPVVNGEFGTRDFSKLLVSQRKLFQDESILLESIAPPPAGSLTTVTASHIPVHELPYYAKWLIIAAWLASFNPARMDALYFMKSSEKKRRRRGGAVAGSGTGRGSQTRKVPRHLLAPSTFTIDRLLSIVQAILPHDHRSTIDAYSQIATMTSLRLLARSSGIGSSDALEAGGKWKVGPAVSWEYVQSLARQVDFGLLDYLAD